MHPSALSTRNLVAVLISIPVLAQQSADPYRIDKERALGQQLASDFRRRHSQPFVNPTVAAYVKRIGSHLVSQLPADKSDYSFEVVLAASVTEPVSLPGRHVFVPAGFLLAAKDEAEFAGVLAHSIGHIALRHGFRNNGEARETLSTVPLVFMGGWMGLHVDTLQHAGLLPLGFLEFQRICELEADSFGLELAARSGYEAAAFRRYVERTQPSDRNLSPLPARDRRLAAIDRILSSAPALAASSNDEFQEVRQIVRNAIPQLKPHRAPSLLR